jgi:hypothetical protein
MGGEHSPAVVYGFYSDYILDEKRLPSDVKWVGSRAQYGRPVYASIILDNWNFTTILEKYNNIENNDARKKVIDDFVEKLNKEKKIQKK